MTDTELLDALEAMHKTSGLPYVLCRESTTGRGWRVHSSDSRESFELMHLSPCGARSATVREAIETYTRHILKVKA